MLIFLINSWKLVNINNVKAVWQKVKIIKVIVFEWPKDEYWVERIKCKYLSNLYFLIFKLIGSKKIGNMSKTICPPLNSTSVEPVKNGGMYNINDKHKAINANKIEIFQR